MLCCDTPHGAVMPLLHACHQKEWASPFSCATRLQEAEQRAQEAEEEQMRAEQMLGSATAELRALQAGAGGGLSNGYAADDQVCRAQHPLAGLHKCANGVAR